MEESSIMFHSPPRRKGPPGGQNPGFQSAHNDRQQRLAIIFRSPANGPDQRGAERRQIDERYP